MRECLLLFGAESFFFQFAIQNINNKLYITINWPVVFYG